jgi:hypothetical protein
MTLRRARANGEVELAQPASQPPLTKLTGETCLSSDHGHGSRSWPACRQLSIPRRELQDGPATRTIDPMTSTHQLKDRYVAMWNEPDAATRRQAVRDAWARTGRQVLAPPKDVIDVARSLGFPSPTLEVAGHDDLEFRVTRAHEEFVAPGDYVFRARPNIGRLHDIVLLGWDMIATATGDSVGGGTDVLLLDGDDRILVDYQFIDP